MTKYYNQNLQRTFWYLPRWPEPAELFKIPFHGASFWVWAKFDRTTLTRIPTTLIAILLELYFGISLFWIVAIETGIQISNGTGNSNCIGIDKCSQAFNLIDFAPVLGLVVIAWRIV